MPQLRVIIELLSLVFIDDRKAVAGAYSPPCCPVSASPTCFVNVSLPMGGLRMQRCGASRMSVLPTAPGSQVQVLAPPPPHCALQLGKEFPQTAEAGKEAAANVQELGAILQGALDRSVQAELSELEQARLPEIIKSSKRQRIRPRGDPYRPKRKRVVSGAIYCAEGVATGSDSDVAAAMSVEWALVIQEHESDNDASRFPPRAFRLERGRESGDGSEVRSERQRCDPRSLHRAPIGFYTSSTRARSSTRW